MTERLLHVAVVARLLNVCPATVRNWIRQQKILAIRLPSGYYRIPLSELDRLRNSQKSQSVVVRTGSSSRIM